MRLLVAVGVLSWFVALSPSLGASPPLGVAYDLVIKDQWVDPIEYTSRSFEEDFRAASEAEGSPIGLSRTLATTGIAERHYLTSSKKRIDNVTLRKAAILDCSARTVTLLDLVAGTYAIHSINQPSPSPLPALPKGAFDPNNPANTKLSDSSETTALGSRTFDDTTTEGYRSDETFTFEIPRVNLQVWKLKAIRFYTKTVIPRLDCDNSRPARAWMAQVETSQLYAVSSLARMHALDPSDPSVKIISRGVTLPDDRLPLLEAARLGMESDGTNASRSLFTERGHIRTIQADDPILNIPHGFRPSPSPGVAPAN